MKIEKQKLIERAGAAVADRGLNYGKPEDNFNRIARRWRAHLANRFGVHINLDAVSVAMMCADLKLARLENTPEHLDSWVDLAGYSACGANIAAEDPDWGKRPTEEVAVAKLKRVNQQIDDGNGEIEDTVRGAPFDPEDHELLASAAPVVPHIPT